MGKAQTYPFLKNEKAEARRLKSERERRSFMEKMNGKVQVFAQNPLAVKLAYGMFVNPTLPRVSDSFYIVLHLPERIPIHVVREVAKSLVREIEEKVKQS